MRCVINQLKRLLVIAGILGCRLYAQTPFHPMYSAQGVLAFRHLNETNQVDFEQIWRFGVQEDNLGRWKMELHTQLPITNMPLRADQYISYDGTNIYSILYSPDKLVTSPNAPAKLIAGDNFHPARVSTGPYPVDYTSVGGILWLAFIGGGSLDVHSNQMKFPDLTVADPRNDLVAWSCDFRYELAKSTLRPLIYSGQFVLNTNYLPQKSTDYREIDDVAGEIEFEKRENLLKQLRNPTPDMLTRSSYQIEETNILDNGIVIPTKFYCDVFALNHSKAYNHIEVTVTNQTPFGGDGLMPELKGIVTVTDQRMRHKDKYRWRRAVLYNLDTNGWIIATNNIRIVSAVAAKPLEPVITETVRPVVYGWSATFFVILLFAPLVWIFRRKSRMQIST